MAQETAFETQQPPAENNQNDDLWSGGKKPFKASYGKLMMWYFLLSDAFTFAGFLIAYGALRFSMPTWPVPDFVFKTLPGGIEGAPLIFVTIMTFVLIVSSVTMVRAVQEGHRENKKGAAKWILLTIVGGAIFLGCQAWEWTNLIATEGMSIYTNPFSAHTESGKYLTPDELKSYAQQEGWEEQTATVMAHGEEQTITYYLGDEGTKYYVKRDHHGDMPEEMSFESGSSYLITYNHDLEDYMPGTYLATTEDGTNKLKVEEYGPKAFGALFFFITGFHGFHVFSGLVFLAIILMNVTSGIYVKRQNGYEMVEKVGLYWHFVDLVWVFVFLVFYLI